MSSGFYISNSRFKLYNHQDYKPTVVIENYKWSVFYSYYKPVLVYRNYILAVVCRYQSLDVFNQDYKVTKDFDVYM